MFFKKAGSLAAICSIILLPACGADPGDRASVEQDDVQDVQFQARASVFKIDYPVGSANRKEWRGVVYLNRIGASAIAVGPRVLATAGHNIADRFDAERLHEEQTISIKLANREHEARCQLHPGFRPSGGADLALCSFPNGEPFRDKAEYVDFDLPPAGEGDRLLIFGYGCVDRTSTNDANFECPDIVGHRPVSGDGITALHFGCADVEGWDAASGTRLVLEGGAAFCNGDSGGPAFRLVEGRPWVVGVAAEKKVGGQPRRSLIIPFSVPETLAWIEIWAAGGEASRLICGLNAEEEDGCRRRTVAPAPDIIAEAGPTTP